MVENAITLKAAYDDRLRRVKMAKSAGILLWSRYCNPGTAGGDWGSQIEFLDQFSNFSFSEGMSVSGYPEIISHFQSGSFDPVQWYASLPELPAEDTFNMPDDVDKKCRLLGLSYAGQVLYYAFSPAHLGMKLNNPHQANLIMGWFLEENKPRLLGKFSQAIGEYRELFGP